MLDTPVRPSHGFQHSFKTMCREAGIPEEIHDSITGHDDGSVSRGYGERHLLKTQYEHLIRVQGLSKLKDLLC
jgi:integrase